MQEGKVNLWLKEVGDTIDPGEEIIEVESEKISGAVEASVSGVLRRQVAQPDEVLPVGALLGIVAEKGASDADIDADIIIREEHPKQRLIRIHIHWSKLRPEGSTTAATSQLYRKISSSPPTKASLSGHHHS